MTVNLELKMLILPLVLRRLQTWDQRRSGVPGEHWAAFGIGLALLQASRPGRSPWFRVAAAIGGTAMIWRAASGRDGFLRERREQAASGSDSGARGHGAGAARLP